MGTYSSGGAGWILLDISMTALTSPVTFSYTLSLERSRLAVGGGLISWGCSWIGDRVGGKSMSCSLVQALANNIPGSLLDFLIWPTKFQTILVNPLALVKCFGFSAFSLFPHIY